MKDFMEIMNFCGYDMPRANAMAHEYKAAIEEILTDAGLETLDQMKHKVGTTENVETI